MTATDTHIATVGRAASLQQRAAAAVYDAECALHAARQTGVPEWIDAAAARLVTAVERSRHINRHPCIRAAA
jgi:thioredoxin-like negative regulator of GroEL